MNCPRSITALLLLLLPACKAEGDDETATDPGMDTTGSATATPTSSTGSPGGACPDRTEANDCCCFEILDEGLATYCMPEPPCGTISGECVDKGAADCNVDPSEAGSVECVLSALQANTAGSYTLSTFPAQAPFDWSYEVRLFADGAGTVFWLDYLADSDFSSHYGGAKRFEIANLGLGACSALPQADADARFDCLRAAFVKGTPIDVCIEPFNQP